ncbi:MAG: DnaD domain protein [Oscillospiraceae bacterium]|nr:DnaD domain protein [Oscillospiraceae bacterium]
MKFKLKIGPSSESDIILPRKIAELLPGTDIVESKLIIYLYAACSDGLSQFDAASLSGKLPEEFEKDEIARALSFWRGAGVIEIAGKKAPKIADMLPVETDKTKITVTSGLQTRAPLFDPEKKPCYTSEELSAAIDNKKEFKQLLAFTETRVKKPLNTTELSILYSFYDYLALPTDVIMLATEHCVAEGKKSLRYIEKLLIAFCENGINTYDAAEAYIQRYVKYKSFEGKLRAMCGIGERELTKNEKTAVGEWSQDKFYTDELIKCAYEITVNAINKPSISYMKKVMDRWRADGIDTPEKVAEEYSKSKSAASSCDRSFDTGDFFQAAVEKARRA